MSESEVGLAAAGPTVFLHIGTPKSGTTYLQTRIAESHELAREQGLLWPGPRWDAHVKAAGELTRLRPGKELKADGPWMTLARTAKEWSGPRVLISMEWLVDCTPEQVTAAVHTLAPARVEVICTARDLLRSFAAQWQEMTKNRRTWTWDQFVEQVVQDQPGPARDRFWDQHDIPSILQTWASAVPIDRIHLVTVPPATSDPELLWQRFCDVISLDGSEFRQPVRANESLGVVSAVLMQRLNVAVEAARVTPQEYRQVFYKGLVGEVLAPRRGAEGPIAVSADVDAWVRRRAGRLVEETRDLGVDVVGDLADLIPGDPLAGREPSQVGDSELLATCIEALVTLSVTHERALAQVRSRNRTLQKQVTRLRGRNEPVASEPRRSQVVSRAQLLLRRAKSRVGR